jgi:hypothetical protein
MEQADEVLWFHVMTEAQHPSGTVCFVILTDKGKCPSLINNKNRYS